MRPNLEGICLAESSEEIPAHDPVYDTSATNVASHRDEWIVARASIRTPGHHRTGVNFLHRMSNLARVVNIPAAHSAIGTERPLNDFSLPVFENPGHREDVNNHSASIRICLLLKTRPTHIIPCGTRKISPRKAQDLPPLENIFLFSRWGEEITLFTTFATLSGHKSKRLRKGATNKHLVDRTREVRLLSAH